MSFAVDLTTRQTRLIKRLAWGIPAGIVFFGVIGLPFANIGRGHTGVDTFFGQVVGSRPPGWSFKLPFIEVNEIDNQARRNTIADTQSPTKDLQVATINLDSSWSILPGGSAKLYQNFGEEKQLEETVIIPGLLETQKALSAKYSAYQLQQRAAAIGEEAKTDMTTWINHSLAQRGLPPNLIDVQTVLFPHVAFSTAFADATKLQTQTEQSIGTHENQRTKAVTDAKASAAAEVRQAQAHAKEILLLAQSEHDGIIAKANSLRKYPGLICLQLQQGWNGVSPEITSSGENPLPYYEEVCGR